MIVESESSRVVTRFRVSNEPFNAPLALLEHQSMLAVAVGGADVRLWNLAKISHALEDLGLPWDRSLNAISEPPGLIEPVEIVVNEGTMPEKLAAYIRSSKAATLAVRARELSAVRSFDEASELYREAIELSPDDGRILNEFAWRLVSRPDRNAEHVKEATELAQRAVRLVPKQGAYWNTLGVAQYRNDEFDACIGSLEKAEELSPRQWFAMNAYFIAMAHWKLGNAADARRWYSEAVEDHEVNNKGDAELIAIQHEAAAVMQMEPK